ncbi:MAG: hypothetical protein FJY85_23555 [Deltaproteobacteria bacterium]|nr:hypothetical protein [Deltaproteobacteria bacterium]
MKRFALVLILSGCQTAVSQRESADISGKEDQYPSLRQSYHTGEWYETRRDLFLAGIGTRLYLTQPGGPLPFVASYESKPEKYPKSKFPFIHGVVQKGTRIEIIRVEFRMGRGSVASGTTAIARLRDGPFSGAAANLHDISDFRFGTEVGVLAVPDTNFVQRIEAPSSVAATTNAGAIGVGPQNNSLR